MPEQRMNTDSMVSFLSLVVMLYSLALFGGVMAFITQSVYVGCLVLLASVIKKPTVALRVFTFFLQVMFVLIIYGIVNDFLVSLIPFTWHIIWFVYKRVSYEE